MRENTLEQATLAPARVLNVLPDLPGGPPNLLPVAALAAPLSVKLPKWSESGGLAGPRVRIFWDGHLAVDETLERNFDDDDLYFDLSSLDLSHGPHRLSYEVTLGNGSITPSEATQVNVDLVPPGLGAPPARIGLPADLSGDLTDDYLQAHGDELIATLPPYGGQAPGDQVTWYWDRRLDANEPLGQGLVAELTPPMSLVFPGDAIRGRGDGARFIHYRLTDYAGNASQSGIVQLDVRATPIPRILPVPQVVGATGSGPSQSLAARQALGGIEVQIPATAVIKPGETASLVFGEPGQVGGARVPLEGAGQSAIVDEYAVAAHLERSVSIRYEAIDLQGTVHRSDELQLALTNVYDLNFPTVECALVDGSQLSLARVPPTGAPLSIAPWLMMTDYQRLMVRVSGVDRANQPLDEAVVEGRQVDAEELNTGIGLRGDLVLPKALLNRLQLNEAFYVEGYLSFDGSGRWPSAPTFKTLVPTLVR